MNGWLFALIVIVIVLPVFVLGMWLAYTLIVIRMCGVDGLKATSKVFAFRPHDWFLLRQLVALVKWLFGSSPADPGSPGAGA